MKPSNFLSGAAFRREGKSFSSWDLLVAPIEHVPPFRKSTSYGSPQG
jgi:hypothetical protein